jgi:hypothetical protein
VRSCPRRGREGTRDTRDCLTRLSLAFIGQLAQPGVQSGPCCVQSGGVFQNLARASHSPQTLWHGHLWHSTCRPPVVLQVAAGRRKVPIARWTLTKCRRQRHHSGQAGGVEHRFTEGVIGTSSAAIGPGGTFYESAAAPARLHVPREEREARYIDCTNAST